MSIIYIITEKIADTAERLTSPAHGAYGFGAFLAKALLFGIGVYAGYWAVVWIRVFLVLIGVMSI